MLKNKKKEILSERRKIFKTLKKIPTVALCLYNLLSPESVL